MRYGPIEQYVQNNCVAIPLWRQPTMPLGVWSVVTPTTTKFVTGSHWATWSFGVCSITLKKCGQYNAFGSVQGTNNYGNFWETEAVQMGPGRKPQRAICVLGVLQGLKSTKVSKHNNGVTGETWRTHLLAKVINETPLRPYGTWDFRHNSKTKQTCKSWVHAVGWSRPVTPTKIQISNIPL